MNEEISREVVAFALRAALHESGDVGLFGI